MSPIETVYLIASAASVDTLLAAVATLSDAGYLATSSADYSTLAGIAPAIMAADAIVTVAGWESSPGAAVEVSIASAIGKPVLTLSDLLPLAA